MFGVCVVEGKIEVLSVKMFVVTFVWDENLKNPFQLIVIDLYITILGYFVNDLYKCLTCAFQWLSNEKKNIEKSYLILFTI